MDETGRLKTLGDPTLINFAISSDSEFLRWFKEESMGIFNDWALMHFVICNSDTIIDVISSKYPIVEWT